MLNKKIKEKCINFLQEVVEENKLVFDRGIIGINKDVLNDFLIWKLNIDFSDDFDWLDDFFGLKRKIIDMRSMLYEFEGSEFVDYFYEQAEDMKKYLKEKKLTKEEEEEIKETVEEYLFVAEVISYLEDLFYRLYKKVEEEDWHDNILIEKIYELKKEEFKKN